MHLILIISLCSHTESQKQKMPGKNDSNGKLSSPLQNSKPFDSSLDQPLSLFSDKCGEENDKKELMQDAAMLAELKVEHLYYMHDTIRSVETPSSNRHPTSSRYAVC